MIIVTQFLNLFGQKLITELDDALGYDFSGLLHDAIQTTDRRQSLIDFIDKWSVLK